MRFDELRREQYELGIAKGIEQGTAETTEQLNKLTSLLLSANRIDELKKAAEDTAFQQQLLEEFGLLKKE